MHEIRIEVCSWLADKLISDHENPLNLKVEEGTTISIFLSYLSDNSKIFNEYVFNVKEKKLKEHILIFVNDRYLELNGGKERILQNGDCIIIVPIMSGG